MKTLFRRPLRLLLLSCVFGLATASAATVSYDGSTMTFTAAAGESNDVQASQSGTAVTVSDANNPVTAPGGCTQNDSKTVTCPAVTALNAAGGDQSDYLVSDSSVTVPETLDGGDGSDCVAGGAGDDVVHGGSGDDFCVNGGPGADHVYGDAGDDQLYGGPGLGTPADNGDVISGGSGIDSLYYDHSSSDNTTPVSLTLDDQANDGLAGEGDNIMSDVEDVQAGFSNPSTIAGDAGVNALYGGSGNDSIDPGAGNDFVYAYGGDDTINTNDGYADRVSCGDGNDTVNADEFDIVSDNCETVNRTTRGSLATEDKAPTISWTAPAENAVMSTTAPNTLSVNAADDKGISQVIFLSGERTLCTVTAAPYTCAYKPTDADVGRDTLTAVVIDTSQQSASALRTVTVPRFRPTKVSSKTTPTRDRHKPFKFRTTGTVSLPVGVSQALGCKGAVGVIFKAGAKTISSRTAHLSKTCRFSRSVTFTIPRRLHPKTLKVEVRFRGNAVLSARSAKSRHVKVK